MCISEKERLDALIMQKKNDTYILENNEGHFLEFLHYYLEYKKLLNDNSEKERIDEIIKEVNKFISNCWCSYVENVLEYEKKGQMYSSEWLMKNRDILVKSLSDTLDLKERYDELKNFTISYFNLGEEIFDIMERACDLVDNQYKYSYNDIKIRYTNINQSILNLEGRFIARNKIALLIREDIRKGKTNLALKERQYILDVIEGMFSQFTSWFHTDLMQTEFKKYFEVLIKKIEDSISIDELVIQSSNEKLSNTKPGEGRKILDEKSNKDKVLHNNIFKNNAFNVWQSMFDSFEITDSSRTDVKFMYEEMKKDGLIFETVNQKTFLDWISKTYQIVVQKTSNHSKTPKRNSIYSNAKQLYKSLDT